MPDISKIKLPNNVTYDLRVLSDHYNPIMSKTFTNVIGTANDWANATFFYGSIKPTDFYTLWSIKYRIYVEAAGSDVSKAQADVGICGSQNILNSWYSFNQIQNISYQPAYYNVLYRAKSVGFQTYGHALGLSLYLSWYSIISTSARTVKIDILECKNCTFTFFDNMLKYTSIPGTGDTNYDGYSEINFYENGLQAMGDKDTINEYAGDIIAGPNGIKAYSLHMKIDEDQWEALTISSSTSATDKTKNSTGFLVTSPIIYCTSNQNSGGIARALFNWFVYRQVDTRYSFNVNSTWSTRGKSLYLVGTITDNKFYLKDTTWWADELPISEDGYYYWYVGQMISSYQVALHPVHPIFYFKNNKIQQYIPEIKQLHNAFDERPTSADVLSDTRDGAMKQFKATSNMTTGKPQIGDAHVLHFGWDTTAAWDTQVAFSNSYSGMNAAHAMAIRSCNGNNNVWGDWKSLMDLVYPIGSEFITSTNTNPSNSALLGGGTWTLIKRVFENKVVDNAITWNNTNVVSGSGQCVFWIRDTRVTFRIRFTNKVAISDTALVMGTIDLSKLGINGFYYNSYVALDDTGNAGIMMDVQNVDEACQLRTIDIVGGGTVAAKTTSSPQIILTGELTFSTGSILDSACNQFVWKRTA